MQVIKLSPKNMARFFIKIFTKNRPLWAGAKVKGIKIKKLERFPGGKS
jgi:hypothetical protein